MLLDQPADAIAGLGAHRGHDAVIIHIPEKRGFANVRGCVRWFAAAASDSLLRAEQVKQLTCSPS
jgi:hypothetical protein